MKVVCVCPNPSLDKRIFVDEVRFGEVVRVERITLTAGGKGTNVARALKILGAEVLVVAPLGGWTGKAFEEAAKREGLELLPLHFEGETRMNITVISRSQGEVHFVERWPPTPTPPPEVPRPKVDGKKLLEMALEASKEADIVVGAGSLPYGVAEDFYAELTRKAKSLAAVDAQGEALRLALKASPWLVKVNEEEAREVLGRKVEGPAALAEALHRAGALMACVTAGRKGAAFASAQETLIGRPPEVEVVDSVGSGDAFFGGLIFGLLSRRLPEEALKLALACGSASCQVPISGGFEEAEVKRLLKRVEVMRPR